MHIKTNKTENFALRVTSPRPTLINKIAILSADHVAAWKTKSTRVVFFYFRGKCNLLSLSIDAFKSKSSCA